MKNMVIVMNNIKYVLIYYVRSKYLGMKKQRIELFKTRKELTDYMYKNKLTLDNCQVFEEIK